MVHCGSIRQTASITEMSAECLRTGDKARVKFRFVKHPEYLQVRKITHTKPAGFSNSFYNFKNFHYIPFMYDIIGRTKTSISRRPYKGGRKCYSCNTS